MTENVQQAMAVGMLPAPTGWVRNTDGRWEFAIGQVCPPDRSSGFSTWWVAVYDAPTVRQALEYAATPPESGGQGDAVNHKAAYEAMVAGAEKALDEIEDDGPKALKYAAQEIRAALQSADAALAQGGGNGR